jgi:WD40 repeat protein
MTTGPYWPSDLGLSGWHESEKIWRMAILPNCRDVVCASQLSFCSEDEDEFPPKLRLVSLADGKSLKEFTRPMPIVSLQSYQYDSSVVSDLTISGDGNIVAGWLKSGGSYLWDVISGQLIRTIPGDCCYDDDPQPLALSADGTLLARCVHYLGRFGANSEVELWDIKQDRFIKSFPNLSHVGYLTFSHDSTVVAAGCRRGDGGHLVYLLAVADADGSVPDVLGWQTLGSCSKLTSLAFRRDGTMLAASDDRGRVCIWNLNAARLNVLLERPVLQSFLGLPPYDGNKRLGDRLVVQQDLEWIYETLRNADLSGIQRQWLDFAERLIAPLRSDLTRLAPESRETRPLQKAQTFGHKGDFDWSEYTGGHKDPL